MSRIYTFENYSLRNQRADVQQLIVKDGLSKDAAEKKVADDLAEARSKWPLGTAYFDAETGMFLGDERLAKYRLDVDRDKKTFSLFDRGTGAAIDDAVVDKIADEVMA